jgi:hypothetical protein
MEQLRSVLARGAGSLLAFMHEHGFVVGLSYVASWFLLLEVAFRRMATSAPHLYDKLARPSVIRLYQMTPECGRFITDTAWHDRYEETTNPLLGILLLLMRLHFLAGITVFAVLLTAAVVSVAAGGLMLNVLAVVGPLLVSGVAAAFRQSLRGALSVAAITGFVHCAGATALLLIISPKGSPDIDTEHSFAVAAFLCMFVGVFAAAFHLPAALLGYSVGRTIRSADMNDRLQTGSRGGGRRK